MVNTMNTNKFSLDLSAVAAAIKAILAVSEADALDIFKYVANAIDEAETLADKIQAATILTRMNSKDAGPVDLNTLIDNEWFVNKFLDSMYDRIHFPSELNSLSAEYDEDELNEHITELIDMTAYNMESAGEFDMLEAIQTVRRNDEIIDMTREEAFEVYLGLTDSVHNSLYQQFTKLYEYADEIRDMIEEAIEDIEASAED